MILLSCITYMVVQQFKRRVSWVKCLLHNLLWVWVESENKKQVFTQNLFVCILLFCRRRTNKRQKVRFSVKEMKSTSEAARTKQHIDWQEREENNNDWIKSNVAYAGGRSQRCREEDGGWLTGARSESWHGNTAEGAEISGPEDDCRSH